MTRGLDRRQTGVTEAMLRAWGDIVFELSHNYQVRRGDPVRELNWDEIERQREGTGMSDPEIARKLGLTRDQVTFIRVMTEHRRYRRRHYHRLYELGGGRRFRAERFVPHEERFAFSEEAMALRNALSFDPELSARYLRDGSWTADTVRSWLEARAAETPDAEALRHADGSLSWGDAVNRSRRLANALLDLGIRKGDVVAVQLPNVPEFALFYFAATMIGAVVSTMHMPYRAGEMEPLLRHANARAVLCGGATDAYDAPATMMALRERVETFEHVVVATGAAPPGAVALQALIDGGSASAVADPPVAADPAILCFTSGTSAAPRAVLHNFHTMLSNNRIAAPIYRLSREDVVLGLPPFTHAFGLCVLNFALMAGATSLLMPAFEPAALMKAIEDGKPSVLFAAPAHIAACAGLLASHDLSSLRLATISGSACPPEVARMLDDAMPTGAVGQMWGMSECFMGLHTPFEAPAALRRESLGGPTPGFEVRVMRTDGVPAGDGEEGELEIRGCSVIASYVGNEEANRAAFAGEGWFRTGDLAVRRAPDDVRITGRLKDLINRGGVKINPTDIEALVDRHPAVAMSAVAPVPDPVLGERACAYVQLAPGASLTLDDVREWLRKHEVAKMKWPEALEFVDRMPMTPTRKIVKSALGKSRS